MSEIADELERLAKEFEEAGKVANVRPQEFEEPHNQTYFTGKAAAYLDVARRLRERAAELRAQRSEPAYRPQPKPAEVRAGQWWAFAPPTSRSGEPGRVDAVIGAWAEGRWRNGSRWTALVFGMLNEAECVYLGDGPEPAR